MAREETPREWPLVAAGIVAGVLTGLLTIALLLTRGDDVEVEDLDRVVGPDTMERVEVERNTPLPVRVGPLIGTREASITARLGAFPVATRPLRGPILIRVRNVVWNDDAGAGLVRAEALSASLNTDAVRNGDIVLDDLVIVKPVVSLRQDGSGRWNYEQVLDAPQNGLNGDPPAGPPRTVMIHDIRIDDGIVDVTRPGERFALRSIDARFSLASLSQPGVPEPYIDLDRVTFDFARAEPETQVAVEVSNGLFAFPHGMVRFDIEDAALDNARLAQLQGTWNPDDPAYGVSATGRAVEIAFADIAFLLPDSVPVAGTASFVFAVQPVEPDLTELALSELDVTSNNSRVAGDVTMRLGDARFELRAANLALDPLELDLVEAFTGELPYQGDLNGRITGTDGEIAFDLVATLTSAEVTTPFDAGLVGRVSFTESGVVLQRAEITLENAPLAAIRAVAPGVALSGTVTGVIALSGPPASAPLELDVRLELGAGVALLNGELDLTGDVPAYDLRGQLLGVDIDAVIEPDVPPVLFTTDFALAGTGFDPTTMDATVRLDGRFSGWEATTRDTVMLDASIRDGSLTIETLHASLASADLTASGTWWFVEPQRGAVAYSLDVASLRPFGPYVPGLGDSIAAGSIRANGTVSGTLERLRVAGEAEGTGFRFGDWHAGTFAAEYDVSSGGGELPAIIVNAEVRDITTPTAGRYSRATLAARLASPEFEARFDAARTDGGVVEIVATGSVPELGDREIVLERAVVDVNDERWALVAPTRITWTAGSPAYVHDLTIQSDSDGRVAIDGYVLPLRSMDARVDIAAVPIGDIQRLLGREAWLDGIVWAEGTVRGGETDAAVDLTFRVDSGTVAGVLVRSSSGRFVYADSETRFDAQIIVDTAGALEVTARLPSVLRIGAGSPLFELLDGVPLSGSVTADRFSLAGLSQAVPQLSHVTGHADARITVAGTADAPEVEGMLNLESGQFRVLSLNQTFTETTVRLSFDGRRLVVDEARMRSDGWMSVGGDVVLERLTEPVIDLAFTFQQFEPMGVDDHADAEVTGEVTLKGPLDGLVMTGAVEIANGYIQIPDLRGPSFRPDIVDITQPAARDTLAYNPDARADVIGNLVIEDLTVTLASDAWIDAFQAQAQLSGELVVNKTGETLPVVGTLSGDRGQFTLITGPVIRRFDIVSAAIQFRGEPSPNPAVDITVRRIVLDEGGRQMDVDVRITGTAENPQLQLAGGTSGQVAESELLSLLLFGVPSSTLGGDRLPADNLLGQTYVGAFWELVSLELERSLGGLGLDIFQIRVGQGTFGFESPMIVAGRQVRSHVFLTLEVALAGLFDDGEGDLSTWALRLDWTFDPRSHLRLAFEPVYRGRGLRSSMFVLPQGEPRQQLLMELRRRWTY